MGNLKSLKRTFSCIDHLCCLGGIRCMHRQTHLWNISLFHLFAAAICSVFLYVYMSNLITCGIYCLICLLWLGQASSEYPTWGGTTCLDYWMLCVHLVYILYIWLHWCIFVSKLYIRVFTLYICISDLYIYVSHVYGVTFVSSAFFVIHCSLWFGVISLIYLFYFAILNHPQALVDPICPTVGTSLSWLRKRVDCHIV